MKEEQKPVGMLKIVALYIFFIGLAILSALMLWEV